ncbi:MFS general substrate transporter [Conidiobolus coronatus NRRL 28638]|uniref:MFS general substrate transporter n=1 Tax=Conidiobolus coronatus (strain ATCC 28846 / CBS 209.66 / NRRL 28638) TaxID=796925 RepID=A0A137P121_CONC2|nr:MFS general substrate transporter [Conidiobolus coronatus NRRL 28638]|eukprot:KXN68766.1 MFS general substrate transporter [Conidiobolus coronatus NRRL 28638]
MTQIKQDFNVSAEKLDMTISAFLFTLAFVPLIWGALSDSYGRKFIYIISSILFAGASAGCALSNSLNLLIGMRVIQSIGSSAPMVVGIGTITDVYPRESRGLAMGIFFLGPLLGPVVGPALGGAIAEYIGWRGIFWVLTGLGALLFVLVTVCLPETLAKERRQPPPFRYHPRRKKFVRDGPFFNPFAGLALFKYPPVIMVILYVCAVFSSYYSVASSQSAAMTVVYELKPYQIGLSYLPLGCGTVIGSFLGGKLSDYLLTRAVRIMGDSPPAEVRLQGTWPGVFMVLGGLVATGWLEEAGSPLYTVFIAQFFLGMGMTFVFSGTSTYLIDMFPRNSASAMACNNFLRFFAAALTTMFNSAMLIEWGFGKVFTGFAIVQCIGVVFLVILTFYGERMRESIRRH